MNTESCRNREIVETTNCRLRNEELEKSTLEERLTKVQNELQHVKSEHITVKTIYNSLNSSNFIE